MKNIHKALILTSSIMASNVQADVAFNGFASIVGGITTSSDEVLSGYDDSFDFSQDSLLALQASSELSDGLTITAQVLARGSDDWETSFEWAYIAYDATDDLRILAGSQRVPFYMFSDFLDVSYAYPWITPPSGVYNVVFDTFDGIGAIYSTSIGSFDANVHVIYGGNTSEYNLRIEDNNGEAIIDAVVDPDYNDLVGIAITLTRDWLTLRSGYLQAEVNVPVPLMAPLLDGWKSTGFPNVAAEIEASGDTGSFIELGFQIDYENILIIGEYTELNLDETALANEDSFYVLAGYRFDNMLVHITYGDDDNSKDRVTNGVPGDHPLFTTTNVLTDAQSIETNYITLGLRWDFHDSAALKFEYTSYNDDLNSNNDAGLFRTALVTVF